MGVVKNAIAPTLVPTQTGFGFTVRRIEPNTGGAELELDELDELCNEDELELESNADEELLEDELIKLLDDEELYEELELEEGKLDDDELLEEG